MAKEGDFASLVVQKRRLPYIAALIRSVQTIEEFLHLAKQHFTDRAIKRISERSILQSQSSFWFAYQRCIITGTLARRIINQNQKKEANEKLNKNITRLFPNRFANNAMMYGIEHEKIALQLLFNLFQMGHEDARIITTGIVLNKNAP